MVVLDSVSELKSKNSKIITEREGGREGGREATLKMLNYYWRINTYHELSN